MLKSAKNRIFGVHPFNKNTLRELLSEHLALLCILVGTALVSISIGPFHNPDTQLEYEAASGVIKWGFPYLSFGNMINQPPIGFYFDAIFFKTVGLSFNTGVDIITFFGLGCTVLVYDIGKFLYGKLTGLFAAALFAMTPWEFALSRSFLIDAQCLFFSLLFLFVGIYAIRKDSFRFFMFSGALFAIAILTKFYAVFALIPLALFYGFYRQKNLRRKFAVAAYFLPAILFAFLWYFAVSKHGPFSFGTIDDFRYLNSIGTSPSYFFVGNYLLDGLGALFLIASVLSLVVSIARRKLFAKIVPFDLMCLVTILAVGGVNTFLGVGLNLSSPYVSPIKYDYQFLPFFSLLAASLGSKCVLLLASMKSAKLNKLVFSVALVGLFVSIGAMLLNMSFVHQFSTWNYLLFRVDRSQNIGYSFVNPAPIGKYGALMGVQYLGFAFVLAGLVWANKNNLSLLHKLIRR
jgi:4-amino-4-deoxy-L-arabinose transferase-like glycosyltransferase